MRCHNLVTNHQPEKPHTSKPKWTNSKLLAVLHRRQKVVQYLLVRRKDAGYAHVVAERRKVVHPKPNPHRRKAYEPHVYGLRTDELDLYK